MIIRSLRLKNIKSYGEGPDGDGVTVHFEPGINRIAGKNGHGKSTLIESLGYALFLTEPMHEESFNVATYLLRAGAKAGEIDVVFDCGGQTYRLERGLGTQQRRRSKVVVVSDGSTEAEGDAEVAAYLCRLFGFVDEGRLSELFSKLIGVKQGRLTWPFDSKSGEARKHFEPLLDVEIFRLCFDRLKPVIDRFEELKHERKEELAAVEERIRERADSQENVKARQQEAEDLEKKVEAAGKEKETSDKQKRSHEQKEQIYREGKAALDTASSNLKLVLQRKQDVAQRVRESQDACETVKKNELAYETHVKAEQELRRLQEQQNEKAQFQKLYAHALNQKTEWQGKAEAARQQKSNYAEQKEEKDRSVTQLRDKIADGQKALQDSKTDFEQREALTSAARKSYEALEHWRENLQTDVNRNATSVAEGVEDWKKVAAWNSSTLTQARAEEERTDRAAKALARKLAEAQKLKETLSEQLEQISGGVCPFLKEKCRQFDPKKIQSDVSSQEREINYLTKEHDQAAEAHKGAKALVERLAKEEARLTQLKKSIADNVESLVAEHNKLIPEATRRHFDILRAYLPKQARLLQVEPLAEVTSRDCFDRNGAGLDTRVLEDLVKAEQALHRKVSELPEKITGDLDATFSAFEEQRTERVGKERDLTNKQEKLREAELEIKVLAAKIGRLDTDAAKAGEETAAAAKRMEELDEKLRPFAHLEDNLRTQQRLKDQNAEGHKKYLIAKPQADRLEERQDAFKKSSDSELQAEDVRRQKKEAFDLAEREFDQAALVKARRESEDAGNRLAKAEAHLDTARNELKREQTRFDAWQTACREKAGLLAALGKLHACMDLTQMARRVLQKAAPKVAQHVCRRVAARAQQIFNQINPELVELEWMAERYSLRINPGDRRFAMLSGGEQTKLALAMTLAMIQEFSGLQFCVFDEPTYAVDADSRQKLADAILRLQDVNESKLDQLLLVSHDDAFEGRIENVVLIRKTASAGSLPCDEPP
jgi:exonuclease SbcC